LRKTKQKERKGHDYEGVCKKRKRRRRRRRRRKRRRKLMGITADDKKTIIHTHTHKKAYSRSFESEIDSNESNYSINPI
jgi:hypothetical protein